jgi:hypothetical protein
MLPLTTASQLSARLPTQTSQFRSFCVIPKASEETAKNLEARLKEKGYNVKYQQRGELSECQHEQVIASSYRADDDLVAKLKDSVAELDNYAVVVHLESRACHPTSLL